MIRYRGLVAALAAATLALSACGSNLSSDSPEEGTDGDGPVVLGVLVDRTAYLKSIDERVLAGINSAVKAVNDSGGVLGGRQLKVVAEDMAADPQREVQAFQRVSS